MLRFNQFILWVAVPSTSRPGKTDKWGIHPQTGRRHDVHDPSIWMSYQQAQTAYATGICNQRGVIGSGIGFTFTENDPLFFIDLDGVRKPDGQWSDLTNQLCQAFAGCYIEISHSGTGIHIIGTGQAPADHGTRNNTYNLELYTRRRFCALTGNSATGNSATVAQPQLDWLRSFPGWSDATPVTLAEWSTDACPEYTGPEDDDELIARFLSSRASASGAFLGKATIQQLWAGGQAAYDCYGGDKNPADAALVQALAFWTGKNCERMDRLFRRSGLMRDKWDRGAGGGKTYGQLTITKEVSRCKAVYGSKQPETTDSPDLVSATPSAVKGELRSGIQMLTITGQVEHFAGCVYVRSVHKVFVPDGDLLESGQFKAHYGGYQFVLGSDNTKTTKNAWEAFTESQGYHFPKVNDICFRPEAPAGGIIKEEGRDLLNTYVPIVTPVKEGDPAPVLGHIAKMLPVKQDQDILLAYMAALVQYPGAKFQWAPLLVGMEGNGKSLITRCLAFAVGQRYTHLPNAQDLGNKFNAWLQGKLFIGIEEVYTADRQDLIETLKPMITNDRMEIQAKGGNQITGDNRANFILCSNHKDAIRKTGSDRRYCIFFTAQQEQGDLERDGMRSNSYFPKLYEWLRADGYAIVNNFLRSYKIPDALNPATRCDYAPKTSSTDEAIKANLGTVEQEVMEAIEECRSGFCGNFISSLALGKLLEERHLAVRMPRNKRADMLKRLGYDPHSAMPGGRCNSVVPLDAGKPILFVKRGSLQSQLVAPSDVVRRYVEAQSAGAGDGVGAAFASTPVNGGAK